MNFRAASFLLVGACSGLIAFGGGSAADLSASHFEYFSGDDQPRARAALCACGTLVAGIDYGRPIWGDRDYPSLPAGFVWQVGNGQPTRLKIAAPVKLGGHRLPPGQYTLFLRHESLGRWSLIVNNGEPASPSRRDVEADIAAIPVSWATAKDEQNLLSIGFRPSSDRSAELFIHWGTQVVTADIALSAEDQNCR